jgi:hypothetical protein
MWKQVNYGTLHTYVKGKCYGLFYDSRTKTTHIAEFIPYQKLPRYNLCGLGTRLAASANKKNICKECQSKFDELNTAEYLEKDWFLAWAR